MQYQAFYTSWPPLWTPFDTSQLAEDFKRNQQQHKETASDACCGYRIALSFDHDRDGREVLSRRWVMGNNGQRESKVPGPAVDRGTSNLLQPPALQCLWLAAAARAGRTHKK